MRIAVEDIDLDDCNLEDIDLNNFELDDCDIPDDLHFLDNESSEK